MAEVIRENIGLLHDKLTVKVTPSDYKKTYEASLKKYSERANIPGFRKGKVPSTVLAKMFGEKVIIEEVLKVSEKTVEDYIKTEKIDIFANPIPVFKSFEKVDIFNLKDYSFDFEIGLRPTIEVKPEDIKVTRYVIDVSDEFINNQISSIQEQFGEMKPKDVVSEDEDVLDVIFDEIDADGIVLEAGISKQTKIKVLHFTEETKKSLLGLKLDNTIKVTIGKDFPENAISSILEELGLDKANPEALEKIFLLTITGIERLEKAVLNEETYSKVYPSKKITSEEELRATVKEEIAFYFAEQSRKQMHDQIYHFLNDHVNVDLPEEYVLKLIEVGDKVKKTREEAIAEYPVFSSQLKWTLLSSHLREIENITLNQDDFINLAKAQIRQYMGGQSFFGDDEKWLNEVAEKSAKDKKFVDDNYGKIFADKLFTALEKKVTPTEESIDFESFNSKLHHHHF